MARSFQAGTGALAEIGERSRSSVAVGGAGNRRTGSSWSDFDNRARASYRPPRRATRCEILCREVWALAVHGAAGQADSEACVSKPQGYVERTPISGW